MKYKFHNEWGEVQASCDDPVTAGHIFSVLEPESYITTRFGVRLFPLYPLDSADAPDWDQRYISARLIERGQWDWQERRKQMAPRKVRTRAPKIKRLVENNWHQRSKNSWQARSTVQSEEQPRDVTKEPA